MPGLLQEILGQAFEKWLIRSIKGVDGAGSTHSRDSSLLGLLVDDSNQGITNEVVAQLTFHNAGAKALIHQLSTSFLATLQVLASICLARNSFLDHTGRVSTHDPNKAAQC